jgi:hypothetical protein
LGGPLTSATVTVKADSVGTSTEHKESAMTAVKDEETSNATNAGTTQGAPQGDALWSPQH